MAFPATPLDLDVEIFVDGVWTDITDYVFDRGGQSSIGVSRGRRDWASRIDASTADLTLNNVDGRFSPRNPVGEYYGLIGRNTPLRVSVNEGAPFLALPGDSDSWAEAPDTTGTSITGDIDIRIELALNNNNSEDSDNAALALATKYTDVGNQRAWAWWVTSDGVLSFRWSDDGTNQKNATATLPLKLSPGRSALRVTMDVDSGDSTSTVTFYRSDSLDGTWSMVGDPVVRSETTEIFDSSEPINIGVTQNITGISPLDARVYAFQLLDGIDGTAVANPDFTDQTVGDTSFDDAAGNTWSLAGDAEITNRNYRFCGEVASWPQKWDLSGNDVYTPLEAAGILRRLSQGSPPQHSSLFREFTNPERTNIVAYWSCEDSDGASRLGSAFPGHPAGIASGSPEFGADSAYIASQPLPKIKDGRFAFNVPSYTVTAETSMRVFLKVVAPDDDYRMFSLQCSGTAAHWELLNSSDGTEKTLVAKDAGGTILLADTHTFFFDDRQMMYDLELTESSGNINYRVAAFDITHGQREHIPTFSFSGTLSSETVGKVVSICIAPDGDMPADSIVGHVVLANDIDAFADTAGAMFAWQGEEAGDRIARLCKEEGISFVRQGFSATSRMGAQTADSFLNLVQECVDVDAGILFEPRDRVGLGYIDRTSLYNQDPQLDLAYDEENLVGSLDPIEDDQSTINDIRINRKNGASARAVLQSGPLSVLSAPDGIGRYTDETTQNLGYDSQLTDAVGWRLKLGTIDEARYPTLSIDLSYDVFSGDAALTERALLMDQGQRFVVSGAPEWLPPDDISQIVQGYTESLTQFGFAIAFNCTPERPYRVSEVGNDDTSHAATDASHITAAVTSTATSFTVATSSGPVWTTDTDDLPIDLLIGGEGVTVTAISGTTSPQTFTVTRSVNGVVKAHSAGDGIRLYQPAILAL